MKLNTVVEGIEIKHSAHKKTNSTFIPKQVIALSWFDMFNTCTEHNSNTTKLEKDKHLGKVPVTVLV